MKWRALKWRPDPAERPELGNPDALDRWIDALLDGASQQAGVAEAQAEADATAGAEHDSIANTARALSDLPTLDPDRQAAMRAALEARFAMTAGARLPADDPASANAQPWLTPIDELTRYLGISAGSLRLLALVFAVLILAGLFLQANRPESAPADRGLGAPGAYDEPGTFEPAGERWGSASEAEVEVEAARAGEMANQSTENDEQPADGSNQPVDDAVQPADEANRPADNVEQHAHAANRVAGSVSETTSASAASNIASAQPRSASSPDNSSTRRYALSGFVRDSDGRGIADAIVTAWHLGDAGFFVQRSEADGRYRLDLSAGQYRLHAEAAGYAERWFDGQIGSSGRDSARRMIVPAADNKSVDFVLPRVGGR